MIEERPAARAALALALGAAAALLLRLPLPVVAEDVPLRLAVVPLLLAFLLLGMRFGLLAAGVAAAGAMLGGLAAGAAAALHGLEALTAARLYPRVHSLPFAVLLFWCTLGALADGVGLGLVMGLPASTLLMVFAGQVFSGALGAFLAEGALRLLPRRWLRPAEHVRLRHYFSRWAMWLVVAPGLLLTLAFARVTWREQLLEAEAEAQRTVWQAASDVAVLLDARGHDLERMAQPVEMELAAGTAPDAADLHALRATRPEFTRLVLTDREGEVVASSPERAATAPPRGGAASRTRYTVAVERAAADSPAALLLAVPLAGPAGAGGTLAAGMDASFIVPALERHRRGGGEVIALVSADGARIAEAREAPARGFEARHATRAPVAPFDWVVLLDQPLARVQNDGRKAVARLLFSFLAVVALLQAAAVVMAGKVAGPLARMDRAAGVLEGGGSEDDVVLRDLTGSPIAEVHQVATRFARMHESLAFHDALTGLPNEKLLLDRLSVAAAQAVEAPTSFTLLLADLDRFRVIDSTLGHVLADELLRKIARRIQDCVRPGDTVARVGGDEFALLLPRVGRMEEATEIALMVMETIKRPFLVAGQDVFVTASVGISLYPRDGTDPETLLKNAVAAAYVAKEQGQDSYRRYTARIKVRDAQRLLIESGLRRALESGGLFLQYQPMVDLASGSILAAEALVRWQREDAVVDAGTFIPVAETSGLITAIDLWVVRTACQQAAAWRRQGHPLRVAVNLSARQLQEPDVVEQVRHALDRAALPPELLEIEVTETVAMRDVERCAEVLSELRRLGVSISVDDFGTGYSSLSFLRRLPVDRVKLDRTFVQDITTNADDAAIATAVIAMSHGLHLTVVAEGVETQEQLEYLRRHGCDAVQGRFFSWPVSADELVALMAEGRRLRIG